MRYKLSNGETVLLHTNEEIAKFILFVMPKEGLKWVGNQPRLVQTPRVVKYFEVSKRIAKARKNLDKAPF